VKSFELDLPAALRADPEPLADLSMVLLGAPAHPVPTLQDASMSFG
jgi:hypothetical protein